MSEVSAYISDFGFGKAWIKARREVGRDERDETEEGIGQKSEVGGQRLCCGSGFPVAIFRFERLQRLQRFQHPNDKCEMVDVNYQ